MGNGGTKCWSAGTAMGSNRSGAAAAVLRDGKVLVMGGHDGFSYLETVEVVDDPLAMVEFKIEKDKDGNDSVLGAGSFGKVFKGSCSVAIGGPRHTVAAKRIQPTATAWRLECIKVGVEVKVYLDRDTPEAHGRVSKIEDNGNTVTITGTRGNGAKFEKTLDRSDKHLEPIHTDETVQELFAKERKALEKAQRLQHRHIIRYFGVATVKSVDHLVMEYCEWGSLAVIVKITNERPDAKLDRVTALAQIASGMGALENANIVHGDLACRNILVSNWESASGTIHVKVTDFGLAKLLPGSKSYTYIGAGAKPVRYLAPEALRGRDTLRGREAGQSIGTAITGNRGVVTHKTDVWAFGVVGWELYGNGVEHPFDALEMQPGADLQAKLTRWVCQGVLMGEVQQHHFAEKPALVLVGPKRLLRLGFASEAHRECPEGIKTILQQCWNENPDDRPCFAELPERLKSS